MININNKEWNELKWKDVQALLSEDDDENFFFEYKNDATKTTTLIKEISALANTYGGYIFLGVDDNKNISGCSTWNEQRINSTIHNRITPTPVFDIKKFKTPKGTVFVIKIEEGVEPPYITDQGCIYERVSSSSCVIKDSSKLSLLYNKKAEQLKKIKNKLIIDNPDISALPRNLCAVLDVGFSVNWSNDKKIFDEFYKTDISLVANLFKDLLPDYGISKVGNSYVISAGVSAGSYSTSRLLPANLHQFIEVMVDGSIKFRIPLYSIENGVKVDISSLVYMPEIFKDIYSLFFGKNISKNFVCAYKYESLILYKQFIPFYNQNDDKLKNVLPNHLQKYGGNVIITGNRIPKNDFEIIERRSFDRWKVKYNEENLLTVLFRLKHMHLGFVDNIKE